jgi:hypothetical protein
MAIKAFADVKDIDPEAVATLRQNQQRDQSMQVNGSVYLHDLSLNPLNSFTACKA